MRCGMCSKCLAIKGATPFQKMLREDARTRPELSLLIVESQWRKFRSQNRCAAPAKLKPIRKVQNA